MISLPETTMNTKPIPGRSPSFAIAAAAALSTVIVVGLLTAVTTLFQSRGAPLAQLASAERVCAAHAYVSAREICMREWLAASQARRIASR